MGIYDIDINNGFMDKDGGKTEILNEANYIFDQHYNEKKENKETSD